MQRTIPHPFTCAILMAGAMLPVMMTTEPFAGSWNDGSRLATVEALVDHGTFAIDRSIFVGPAQQRDTQQVSPYRPDSEILQQNGTLDKMLIDGRFYSDKPPVPAVISAGLYYLWQQAGGPTAAENPEAFCRAMTFSSSGISYVVAVCCIFFIGCRVGLGEGWSVILSGIFALGTMALPYLQTVNSHIQLLAIAALIQLLLLGHLQDGPSRLRSLGIGLLAGWGYSIEPASGGLMCAATGGMLVITGLRHTVLGMAKHAALFALGLVPFAGAHHTITYLIAGTLAPANTVPAFFEWQGSPFHSGNLTGIWNHDSVGTAGVYALEMLAGKRGFFGHNLPLLLLIPAIPFVLRRAVPEWLLLFTGLGWGVATWLLYSATSRNLSGQCCSVRWFLPMLAPGFVALAIILRELPRLRSYFLILSVWALMLGSGMAAKGPWTPKMIPYYWQITGGAVGSCLLWMWLNYRWSRRGQPATAKSLVQEWQVVTAPDRNIAPSSVEPAQKA